MKAHRQYRNEPSQKISKFAVNISEADREMEAARREIGIGGNRIPAEPHAQENGGSSPIEV
ncbi:MAG: hypothetical protein ABIR36_17225 [Nitrospiraceae bacterium]